MIDGFSGRSVILFIIAMIAATVLTGEATYYVITRFVFDDQNDPLAKVRGMSLDQKKAVRDKIVQPAGLSSSR
jgi:hypothetical protein